MEIDNFTWFGGSRREEYRAEEHSDIFLYEPRGIIGSQDHIGVEAQRRIEKRLHDTIWTLRMPG